MNNGEAKLFSGSAQVNIRLLIEVIGTIGHLYA